MEHREQEQSYGFALQKGAKLHGRYEIQGVLGVGGFGITYEGYDVYNRDVCAIKELFINDSAIRDEDGRTVHPTEGKAQLFQHGIVRFMEEAEILHKLNGTPNVVSITDYFRENQTAYFVMEYIRGCTLGQWIQKNGGKLPLQDACRLIWQIGTTLNHIYEKHSIIHRDLSPGNILLKENGAIKIIDFGNAKTYIRDSGQSHSIVLKPGFAPPEQYTGRNQGPWTDVYALAGIFYYAATGTRVPPSTERLAGAAYPPLCEVLPECPREISDLTDRALQLNPRERIRRVADFVGPLAPHNPQPSHNPQPPADAAAAHPRAAAAAKRVYPVLTVQDALGATIRWRLPTDVDIRLGRDASMCHIVVSHHPQISKQHLLLRYHADSGHFTVTDLSTNGVFCGGKRLVRNQPCEMSPDTLLILGNHLCVLSLEVK